MDAQLIAALLQTGGPLGAILIVCGWALNRVHRQLSDAQEARIADAKLAAVARATELAEVQEKRISDAQAATAKLLELVAMQYARQDQLAKTIDGNTDASRELRQLVESAFVDRGIIARPPANPPRR